MSDKKHIDRIFQEKLKDLEVNPNNAVWKKISSQLENPKKKRKAIPIWWRVAGVAAALLLLLTVGNLILNTTTFNDPPVIVDTDDEQVVEDNPNKVKDNQGAERSFENEILQENNNDVTNTSVDELNTEKESQSDYQSSDPSIINSNRLVNSEASSNDTNQRPEQNLNIPKKDQKSNASQNYLVNNQATQLEPETVKDPVKEVKSIQNEKDGIFDKNLEKDGLTKNNSIQDIDELKDPEDSQGILENTKQEKLATKQDISTLTEDVIVTNEDIDEEEKETINRWQINPNFAPVYFNSLGKGSSIDNQFVGNSKSGNINFSYGINAGYAINDKLTIKSGIHKLKLSYDTEDVIAMQGFAANSNVSVYRNIKFSNPTNLMFLSANNVSLAQVPGELASTLKSTINQELEYIEVPLELKYNLSNKKFGLNVIGGVSLLLLSENAVYAVINDAKTPIGEANNLNETSYSANFGLGLDYNISNSVQLNLDPMFKYQINTFNNTAGDFQPYFIGVYSGINVKF